tara:strand:+ start:33 stop:575 length:543 start_codon:yes stop_codon:yes gene_type:complete
VKQDLQIATLAGGCFWCLEAVYQEVDGVDSIVSGYCGGTQPDPTYEQVCSGVTGHAEAVNIFFDPDKVSYEKLLGIFFVIHDPTTLNRQGGDIGTQYRSAIFFHNDVQKQHAIKTVELLQNSDVWDSQIVTEIVSASTFYEAEQYHQNYYRDNPNQQYCQFVVAPKLSKFRQKYLNNSKG